MCREHLNRETESLLKTGQKSVLEQNILNSRETKIYDCVWPGMNGDELETMQMTRFARANQ